LIDIAGFRNAPRIEQVAVLRREIMRLIALLAPLCAILMLAPASARPAQDQGAAVTAKAGKVRKAYQARTVGRQTPPRMASRRRVSSSGVVLLPRLPRRSPAEIQNEEANRSITLQGRQREIQQQNQFEINQLRSRLDQLW
jgi:hypothetical protein